MRHIKFWANMLLIPVFVIVFFAVEITRLIPRLIWELKEAIDDTKRKYGIK